MRFFLPFSGTLASAYGLSHSALSRHRKHLTRKIAQARLRQKYQITAYQLECLDNLIVNRSQDVPRAQAEGQPRTALQAARELSRAIVLRGKIWQDFEKISEAAANFSLTIRKSKVYGS